MDIQQRLQESFGFSGFRTGQQAVVEQLLAGKSTLAIFPTGAGKSLCYQFTALQLPHLTVVISPLIALIKDQLEFLHRHGIAAASIDSSLSPEQNQQVMRGVRSGAIKILMVSVERFKNERFRQFIEQVPISLMVVDEAHCISEWGHNFRPDYLKLPSYREQLNIPLVLLLTATATRSVKKDMAAKFSIESHHIQQTGFYRNNLDLSVLSVAEHDKNAILVGQIQQQQQVFEQPSGIVYVTLQKSAEDIANVLQQQGFSAIAYHAGLDSERRFNIQRSFMQGDVDIVVATIAFGMGVDKANIRFVIHYDLPKSIENYSQEIGRAGRDGHPSNCLVLANLDGLNTVENFVYGDTPDLKAIQLLIDNIAKDTQQGQWELQGLSLSNHCNIRQLPLKTLLVQLELMGILKPLYAYFADVRFKFLISAEQIVSKFEGERQEFIRTLFENSQLKKVWATPNLTQLHASYGYDRGRIMKALEYLSDKQCIELETKALTEVYQVDAGSLTEEKITQELAQYVTQKESAEIARIQALVRFFELETCLSSNLAKYFDDNNAPEACGHCSACRGNGVNLVQSQRFLWPNDSELLAFLATAKEKLQVGAAQNTIDVTPRLLSQFLAGMSCPIFSKKKLRGLPGFGSCEQQRFAEIEQRVKALI